MSFLGKASYGAGADLPEIAEDVSDIIGIVSPHETPLLDHLGDAKRAATSTVHEWLEDSLLPNTDTVNQTTFTPNAQDATGITVTNGGRFQVGDLVRTALNSEVVLVTAIAGNLLTVVRRYGGTPASSLANGMKLSIIGNAALEGAEASAARYTSRVRRQNYTQIFTATVDVSGTLRAVRTHGVADELDFQKQERLRELLRDLENCVVNGTAPAATPQGSSTVRRSMNGLVRMIQTNQFVPGQNGMPQGVGPGNNELSELVLNTSLRNIWEQSAGRIDTIVCGGVQKRRINAFIASSSRFYGSADGRFSDGVGVYESDFGVCRVVLSRWVPSDTVLLLDSSRIQVMPLAGRSFQYRELGTTGDSTAGQIVGEYTLECRNENAHGLIRGLGGS